MKKVLVASLMTLTFSVSAGWGNAPWSNNNNGPWGDDNGFIAHNPYDMFTPDWFSEEMDDMMDEFDLDNNGPWGNNGWNNNRGPWGNSNGPWNTQRWNNNGPWGNNGPWQNRNWNNGPWNNSRPFNFRTNSFGPMNNGPWNNNSAQQQTKPTEEKK